MKYLALALASLCLGCGTNAQQDAQLATLRMIETYLQPRARCVDDPCPFATPGATRQLAASYACVDFPHGRPPCPGSRPLSAADVAWSSEDTSVATVDSDGLVTFLRPGMARIRMHCESCANSDGEILLPVKAEAP